jgi:hypothetical protein
LQKSDFKGKKLYPFLTYLTAYGKTFDLLKEKTKTANVMNGIAVKRAQKMKSEDIDNNIIIWLNELTETNKETNGFAVKNVSINQFDWGRKSS